MGAGILYSISLILNTHPCTHPKSCLLTFFIFRPNRAQAAATMSASGEDGKSEGSTSRPPPIQLQLPRRPATGAPPIILSLPDPPAGAELIVLRLPSPPSGARHLGRAGLWAGLMSREDEDAFVLSPTVTWALDVPPGQGLTDIQEGACVLGY